MEGRTNTGISKKDLELIFSLLPVYYIIYKTNQPNYTILKISEELAAAYNKTPDYFIGKGAFEAFPDNPDDPEAKKNVQSYKEAFAKAIKEKKEVGIPIQKYDTINPETGVFEEKYWTNTLRPVIDNNGEVKYLINSAKDITELVLTKEREKQATDALIAEQKKLIEYFFQAPVAITIFTGPDFIVELANPSFCNIIDKKLEKILNKPFYEVAPEYEEGFKGILTSVLESGERVVGTEQPANAIIDGKQQMRFFDFVFEPLRDAGGAITGVFTVGTDVTQKVLLRKKIENNEQRLKFSLKASNMGTWELDEENGEALTDARHDEIFGYENIPEDWFPDQFWAHIHPEDRESLQALLGNAPPQDKMEYETRIITPDGQIKWIHVKGGRFSNEDGKEKLFGVVADITEKKVLEMQKEEYLNLLKQYNAELEDATNAKDRFISVISHDLRNPLSVVVASSDIILKNLDSISKAETENFVKTIYNSSNRVIKHLSELVELSKSKTKQSGFNPVENSLHECVNISFLMLESLARHKHISIKNLVPEDIEIFADPYMIQSIFQNLISNAIKFTPEGGDIVVKAKVKNEGLVEVRVIDSGTGMTEEIRLSIFDEAKIVSTKGTKQEKGSGFGLTLVQEFIKKHGGKLWVESEPGKGTCFAFTVPQAKGNITSDDLK
jgi:two-component system, OmpR family, sensor histidine kinase VicK